MLYYTKNTVPNAKPDRLRLSDGSTITSPTHEQLLANGWFVAPEQPNVSYPSVLEWAYPNWVIRGPNESEIQKQWETIKQQCKALLAETDYKVIKAVEASAVNGTSVLDELGLKYVNYRQSIRDIYNNVNNIDPFFVDWPVLEESLNGN